MNESPRIREIKALVELYDHPAKSIAGIKKKVVTFMIAGIVCLIFAVIEKDEAARVILSLASGICFGLAVSIRGALREVPMISEFTHLNRGAVEKALQNEE